MARVGRGSMVESVSRALDILKVVGQVNDRGIRLTELTSETGLTKSTAHRLVSTLIAAGFIQRYGPERRLYLGFEFLALGGTANNRLDMRSVVQPSLIKLAKATGDTVFMCVEHGLDAVYLDRVEGTYPVLAMTVGVGSRRPLGIGGGPLALLSHMASDKRHDIIRRNARRMTKYVDLSVDMLNSAISETRSRGYSYISGRVLQGVSTVGVAIMAGPDRPLAAISLTAIDERLCQSRLPAIVSLLKKEARHIAARLKLPAHELETASRLFSTALDAGGYRMA